MAKKRKNLKHSEAIRRKADAELEMSKLGLTLSDDTALIGFVFSHLSASHITFLGLNSINQLCKTYAGIDICIFSQHIMSPCVPPLCPVFGVSDLIRWHNCPLITTNISTTIESLSSHAPVIYHYAFDPDFINKSHKESTDLNRAFCDPRVRVIVRHESHIPLIESEFGISVCDVVIPDCDAEKLVKFVLMEMKNGDRN